MRQLGPYQLLRKIGSGGMAEVWAARVRGTAGSEERYVAIKLLASHLAERAEYREMFLGEARLSMQLSHPNIVRVFDAVAHDLDCYMVMELISGMTLSQLQRSLSRERQVLPQIVTAYIVGELLRALSYAHQVRTEQGSVVVHRDVSPQNVMVTSDGQVKLMDFGIARFATQETQGAFVKGKLQYMPPEQLRKETRKPTVDLYAVGAILHELLDGKRFRGRLEQAQLIDMVMRGEVPPLRQSVPAQLDIVRKGLLEPDEAARIQTARKALGMLCRWPEYREAASDLRALVQRYVEPAAVHEVPEGSKVSSVPEGSFSGLQGLDYGHDSGHYSDPQLSAAATEPTGSELTADDLIEVPSAVHTVPTPAPRRRGLVLTLAGVGVAAALVGGVLVYSGGEQADAEAPSDARASSEPAKLAKSGEATAPKPAQPAVQAQPQAQPQPPVQPQLPTPTEEAEVETETETGEAQDADEQPGERVTVPVEFVANEFFFVYVKVSGRVLTLEPRDRLELPEGKHTVYLRQSPDEKWTRAGRITLEPGREYRVEMRKPAGLQLVKK